MTGTVYVTCPFEKVTVNTQVWGVPKVEVHPVAVSVLVAPGAIGSERLDHVHPDGPEGILTAEIGVTPAL